ncbi:Uncharacterised protein [Chryseobacterium taklimakanense]|uniref:Uncharacterized protein n=1 Tax=Chryseobacterium taklimakanense TaxID=536441 RepID=A0A239X2D2_9FLAO|nr:Uncharacterised protein [Chryseobacterium taklimakanense]
MKFINSEELFSHLTNETPDAKGGKTRRETHFA